MDFDGVGEEIRRNPGKFGRIRRNLEKSGEIGTNLEKFDLANLEKFGVI